MVLDIAAGIILATIPFLVIYMALGLYAKAEKYDREVKIVAGVLFSFGILIALGILILAVG